ncbi:MAG: signal peptidase II, partial [Microbacterium gubbeenense]
GFGVGHVVDFILTPWMWFWTNPAIYNVADMFIVCGMIAVAVLVLIGINFDGTRGDKPSEAALDEPDAEDAESDDTEPDEETDSSSAPLRRDRSGRAKESLGDD